VALAVADGALEAGLVAETDGLFAAVVELPPAAAQPITAATPQTDATVA
jgi:hypothetical protein